jgi:exonuclease SbcD
VPRLLHLADLHLGVENFGAIDPRRGLHTRLLDYLDRLDEAIQVGLDADIDACLIVGDIYKNRSPNPTVQREFAHRLKRLVEAGIPVIMLVGNHDISPAQGRAHSIEIFSALSLSGVHVYDRPERVTIATRSGPFQLIAVPWVTRHNLMAREELAGLGFQQIEDEVRRRLEDILTRRISELDPTVPTVLAFHGSVDGAKLGSERQMTLGQDLALPRSVLGQAPVDYVALGHIHKHQMLGSYPAMVYPGSIERLDFGERADPKGCVVVDLLRERTSWYFAELRARPLVELRADLRGVANAEAQIAALIAAHDLTDAVVRAEFDITVSQAAELREEPIRLRLREAGTYHIAAVTLHVDRPARVRLPDAAGLISGDASPLKVLEQYLLTREVSGGPEAEREAVQRRSDLLAAAQELINDGSGER